MLLEKIKEMVTLIEQGAGKYSWDAIKEAFKQELPVLSTDAIEKFRLRLDGTNAASIDTVTTAKRKKYGQRRRILGVPFFLDMTVHIIDYLKTCKNMTASKADIFNAIKDNYPIEIQGIPHRSRGKDTHVSELAYRLEWACTILSSNGRAIGHNQDATIPKTNIKLVNVKKFTEAEVAYLKKNRYSLAGFTVKKQRFEPVTAKCQQSCEASPP